MYTYVDICLFIYVYISDAASDPPERAALPQSLRHRIHFGAPRSVPSGEHGTYKAGRARFWPWFKTKLLQPFCVVPSSLGRDYRTNGASRKSSLPDSLRCTPSSRLDSKVDVGHIHKGTWATFWTRSADPTRRFRAKRKRNTLNVRRAVTLKPRLESGRDCLICPRFAQHRSSRMSGDSQMSSPPDSPGCTPLFWGHNPV